MARHFRIAPLSGITRPCFKGRWGKACWCCTGPATDACHCPLLPRYSLPSSTAKPCPPPSLLQLSSGQRTLFPLDGSSCEAGQGATASPEQRVELLLADARAEMARVFDRLQSQVELARQ